MRGVTNRFESIIPLSSLGEFHKRWISDDVVLIFVLERETRSYLVRRYDVSSGSLSPWKPSPDFRAFADVMPVRYFGTDGKLLGRDVLFMKPRVTLSPERSVICWLGIYEELTVLDLRDETIARWPRPNDPSLARQPIWLAESRAWAEPVLSGSGESFVALEMYPQDDGAPRPPRPMRGIRAGACIGTTPGNTLIIESRLSVLERPGASDSVQTVQIAHVDLSQSPCKGVRHNVALPPGHRTSEVSLSSDGRRLAWLLTMSGEGATQSGLWLSGLDGRNMTCIATFDDEEFSVPDAAAPNQMHPFDLEWLPNGNSISFVAAASIYCLNVPIGS